MLVLTVFDMAAAVRRGSIGLEEKNRIVCEELMAWNV